MEHDLALRTARAVDPELLGLFRDHEHALALTALDSSEPDPQMGLDRLLDHLVSAEGQRHYDHIHFFLLI